jgi:tetratricopeptide (TPR) repeat protein
MKPSLALLRLFAFTAALGCAARDPMESFHKANEMFDRRNYGAAIDGYTEAIRADPGLARAWNNRGLARCHAGDVAAAVPDFDEAIRLGPPMAEAFYNRGTAQLRLGDPVRAGADFSDALRLQPEYPAALAARGLARAKTADRDGAAADFRRALEVAPPDWPERPQVERELARLTPPTAK